MVGNITRFTDVSCPREVARIKRHRLYAIAFRSGGSRKPPRKVGQRKVWYVEAHMRSATVC
eukprot:5865130-Pyramimonas_sp.AAC.1